jgi:hypothetical protein
MTPTRLRQRAVAVTIAPFENSQLIVNVYRQQSPRRSIQKLKFAASSVISVYDPVRQPMLDDQRIGNFVDRNGNAQAH